MIAIDLHTHAFPDDIARRAIDKLSAMADWSAVGDGTIDGLLADMDSAGVDASCVCAIATKPGQVRGILDWQVKFARKYDTRLIPIASLHPKDTEPQTWLRNIAESGIPGVKLHPMYQDFCIDDDALRPIYEGAVECGLLVEIHTGRDIGFPDDPIPDRAAPRRVARLLELVPGLRLVCTHMGGWKMWDEVRQSLIGRDVYLETSFSTAFIEPKRLADMILAHGPEKVCFGTDWPWSDQKTELQRLQALGLDEQALSDIRFGNAARLLGL